MCVWDRYCFFLKKLLGCCISSLTYFEMQCKLHSWMVKESMANNLWRVKRNKQNIEDPVGLNHQTLIWSSSSAALSLWFSFPSGYWIASCLDMGYLYKSAGDCAGDFPLGCIVLGWGSVLWVCLLSPLVKTYLGLKIISVLKLRVNHAEFFCCFVWLGPLLWWPMCRWNQFWRHVQGQHLQRKLKIVALKVLILNHQLHSRELLLLFLVGFTSKRKKKCSVNPYCSFPALEVQASFCNKLGFCVQNVI
jgi:hypothetical protein